MTRSPLDPPRHAAALEALLDGYLDAALSSRRTASGVARRLARLQRPLQDWVLHWGPLLARDDPELAFQFTAMAPGALRLMPLDDAAIWLQQALDCYDQQGQQPAIQLLHNYQGAAVALRAQRVGQSLAACQGVLERFVCGLAGCRLKIAEDPVAFTDTEVLYLPPLLAVLPEARANFGLYKATLVHLWAQIHYGTWHGGWLLGALDSGELTYAELAAFHALETLRLDARIARDLPALYRDMLALRAALDGPSATDAALLGWLGEPRVGVRETLRLVAEFGDWVPRPSCYSGVLRPEAVQARLLVRQSVARERLRVGLARLIRDREGVLPSPPRAADEDAPAPGTGGRFAVQTEVDAESPTGFSYQLFLDGQALTPPPDIAASMATLIQDLGELPSDCLDAAGPGDYQGPLAAAGEQDLRPDGEAGDPAEGAFRYPEWDWARGQYRKDWCLLRECEIPVSDSGFYEATLQCYRGPLRSIRRNFEALRGEERRLRRQPDGDAVDFDALVAAYADFRAGLEMSDRLFSRRREDARDICALLMVDLSGSTKGWVNRAEREALILLAEALQLLGDPFAIYGFSGWGRKRCEVFPIKRFSESCDAQVQARIASLEPRDYTRMGAPIRHLTRLLLAQPARTRLLITLSDGKPDDYDGRYRGRYGIEDTRQALIEARAAGISPFCITIDEQGQDYLPHLYGPARFIVIAEVAHLPVKIADIYRRLTR